jgi:hypothetical protein
MAGGEAEAHTHRDLYTACTTTMKPTITPKIAPFTSIPNENGPRIHSTFATTTTQGGQPHHAVDSSPSIILPILSFIFSTTHIPKQPHTSSGLLPTLPLCHNQSSSNFASPTNNLSPTSATNHIPCTKQQQRQPSQNRTQPTSSTSSRTLGITRHLPHSWHHTYNHWRFKQRL